MREKILNIATAIAVLTMMGYICWGLADQFKPEHVTAPLEPIHTEASYKKLEFEATKYRILYRDNDRVIDSISRARIR